jgi:hypothetical protein
VETLVALDAIHAGEALGDLAVLRRQDVDAEEAGLADRVVGGGRLVDANQELAPTLGQPGGRPPPETAMSAAG